MKNAHMLYRCPGPEEFEGVKCETLIVEAEEVEAAKAEGWCSDWMQAHAAREEALFKIAQVEAEQARIAAELAEQKRLEEHVAMERAAQAERDPNAEIGSGEQTASPEDIGGSAVLPASVTDQPVKRGPGRPRKE